MQLNQSKTNAMDMNKNPSVRSNKRQLAETLALAATALVGSSAIAEENDADWQFSASVLAYSEADRVSATEAIFNAEKQYDEVEKLSIKVVLDALTGASANGAIAQNTAQTFTRPSGNGQFVTPAGETPLDDTFKDTRLQINVGWTNALDEDTNYTLGGNLSREFDYDSLSLSAELARSFNQNNTTLSAGLSVAAENSRPKGGIPVPLSSHVIDQGQFASDADYRAAYDATRLTDSDTISSAELLLGWTQVINRRTLMQINYGFANTSGYLTDPFKVVSVVNNGGIASDYLYESRPDSKQQHSIFGLVKHHLDSSIFDVSYRFQTSDWGIDSHTLDMHWQFFADGDSNNGGSFWEPHIRLYQQSAADFYLPYLSEQTIQLPDVQPDFASADYRVGDLTAYTVGLKYGFQLEDGARQEIRLEYYKQTPNSANEPVGIAGLENLELYPEVDAIILQYSYFF